MLLPLANLLWIFAAGIVQSVGDPHQTQPPNREAGDLLGFEGKHIYSLALAADRLAVALQDELVLFKIGDALHLPPLIEEIGRIVLDANLVSDDSALLDFRLINESSVLFCTSRACSTCVFTSGKQSGKECLRYEVDGPGSSLMSAKGAVAANGRTFIRAVRNSGNASVFAYQPGSSTPSKAAPDNVKAVKENIAAAAFTYKEHTYFVGSAERSDLPFAVINGEARTRTDIRITRVCNRDETELLESRIDIVLSCKDIGGDVQRWATAASLTDDGEKLYVAFRNGTKKSGNNVICEYDFRDVQKRFEETWSTCQDIEDGRTVKQECQASNGAHQNCFLFSWQLPERLPVCVRFNQGSSAERYDNCDLARSNITAKRSGWLENFRALEGVIVGRFDRPAESIVAVTESFERQSMFVLLSGKDRATRVSRIRKSNSESDSKTTLWSNDANMMSSLPALHVNDFQMIFYAHFGTIKYTKVSCGGLYDTCDSIAWTDPLQCGWCAERNSTGHTVEVGNKAACASGQLLMRQCSPVIVSVNPGKDEYTIVGEDLTNFEQVKVLVCNRDCRVKYHKSSAIQCEIENAFNCDVVVTGKVGDRNDFTLVQPSRLVDSGTSTEAVGDDANKKVSRTIRIVTAIFGSLFLLVLIVVIYFFYRRLARKRSKRRDEKQKNAIPFDDLSSFDNSSCSPMLNSTHVKVLQLVGGGFSSQVFKAIYQNGSHEETVAVKKIMNGHFEREDVMREIGLMAGCSHKNIVRFIGHYCERGDQTIHIVTEFMEGGDLHKYLQNDENRPTIGLAFSYVLQLVDGMVYLTKQHIIHRDLAARNCMLDKYYQCLKITDFGLCRRSDIDYQYVSFRNGLMPFRWLALECFDENEGSHYSEKSDVWAFGVTVWEIFTRGNPYENMGVFDVQRHLREGQRLPLDTYTCPEELKDVLLQCWAEYPDQRPSFKQLKDLVTNIYDGLKHNSEYMQQQYEVPKSVKDATSPSQSMPPTPMADTTV